MTDDDDGWQMTDDDDGWQMTDDDDGWQMTCTPLGQRDAATSWGILLPLPVGCPAKRCSIWPGSQRLARISICQGFWITSARNQDQDQDQVITRHFNSIASSALLSSSNHYNSRYYFEYVNVKNCICKLKQALYWQSKFTWILNYYKVLL